MFKRNFIFGVTTFFVMGVISPVLAMEIPQFPVCTNVQGSVKASYPSGTHGIPGKYDTYSGSDSVYQLTENSLMQCFCPESASEGIQTNWWKISQLNQEDIDSLVAQGWIYIPNGALWGLDEAPYLAKNINYTCHTTTTTTTSSNNGGSGEGGSSSSPQGGSVQSVSTTGQILSLAATGNMVSILALLSVGISSLTLGIIFKKRLS